MRTSKEVREALIQHAILKRIKSDLPEFIIDNRKFLSLKVSGHDIGKPSKPMAALIHIFVEDDSICCKGVVSIQESESGRRPWYCKKMRLADPEVFEKMVKYVKDNQLDSAQSIKSKITGIEKSCRFLR